MNPLVQILIVGASTRAAAQSAVRAGFRPTCADQFADEDLRKIAEVLALPRYPHDLPKVVANSPDCPWMYTGALENRPALLEKLAALRPPLGNPADVVRAVRNPFRLYRALARGGLPALAARPTSEPPPRNGDWMLKPRRGSAGRGIYLWDSAAANMNDLGEPYYFQERAGGRPVSGLFLASGGMATLVGASEQWIGLPELSAGPFAYCGSSGPIDLPESAGRQIAETGDQLASKFGLRGLFGIDFLLEGEVAWPTEVNPRYTASVEIYERSLELPLIDWHVRACRCHAEPSHSRDLMDQFRSTLTRAPVPAGGHQAAKAIVYAPFHLRAPDLARLQQTPDFLPAGIEIADRPAVGLPVPAGSPFCTLIAGRTNSRGQASFDRALSVLASEFERGRV